MTQNDDWAEGLSEELKLDIRLEGIFMPHSRRKRDGFWPNGKRFAHYTSAEAALGIIGSKRLWMRNATCMSDYREIHHGFDFLSNFFKNKEKRNAFHAALDSCAVGVGEEAIKIFDHWWTDTRLETYITSISEHDDSEDLHGRLSMWRAFGGSSARVAIVFKLPFHTDAAKVLNVMFAPVAYMSESEVHSALDITIKNIHDSQDFLQTVDRQRLLNFVYLLLLSGVVCVKHSGFREEAEWRGVYAPNRASSPLIESSTRVIQGIPQIIHELPLDQNVSSNLADLDFTKTFDRLIVGPSPYPWAIRQAFVGVLRNSGVDDADARVFVSDIPIRS